MKKNLTLLLILTIVLATVLVGCTNSKEAEENATTESTTTQGDSKDQEKVDSDKGSEAMDQEENKSEEAVEETKDEPQKETEQVDGDKGEADYTEEEKNAMFVQMREPQKDDIVVTLTTNFGDVEILMFPEAAPKAVENFVTHAGNGYYDGLIFHRVIDDFMIQGGDPTGTGTGGESVWGEAFEDEINGTFFPFRGALCMANSGPNTNGSQFFIVQRSEYEDEYVEAFESNGYPTDFVDTYKELGGTAWLYGQHTVFGQVTKGMDIVDQIAKTETDAGDKPLEDVIIEKMDVVVIK